ncbi:MAG: cyclic-phosphate processing receiver domain-containing protein, partial [Pirellulales bacterium]
RIVAMRSEFAKASSQLDLMTFDNAPDTIAWLHDHLENMALICLDHDLGPNQRRGESVFDPGTGRDVADFLATHTPVCPVLIHTTNSMAAPGMQLVLEDAGWAVARVTPYEHLTWIGVDWIEAVCKLLD